MTTIRTAVLVDVDGVINAIPRGTTAAGGLAECWPADTWRRANVWLEDRQDGGDIHWSTGVIDGIRRIEHLQDVEMMWCTTWEHTAAKVLAPLVGIGERWPCLVPAEKSEQNHASFDWWKATRAWEALQQHDQVVWIDDDIDAWVSTMEMLGRTDESKWLQGERILTVCPRTEQGLSPHDLDVIERFLANASLG